MQEKKKDSYPLGICQRLFNFIMNGLTASGFKRVTLGRPAVPGAMVEQQGINPTNLNAEVMPVHYLDHENSKDNLVSQIGVSSQEPEVLLELRTTVGESFVSSPYRPRTDDVLLQSGRLVKPQKPKDKATEGGKKLGSETPSRKEQLQGESLQDIDQPNQMPVAIGQPRGQRQTITIKNAAEEEKTKRNGKNAVAKEIEDQGEKVTKKGKNTPSATEDGGIMEAQTRSPRIIGPFLGANIDDMSGEYIRKRKEAMTRSLEPRKNP